MMQCKRIICRFDKGFEGEFSRLAASSEFVQEGISFKGISIENLAKFIGETSENEAITLTYDF